MKHIAEIKAMSLAQVVENGFVVAFIEGNREIVKKNVQNKKDSFEDFHCNIIPILYVKGEKAVEDGCKLVDVDGNPIADPAMISKSIAIVDGQHRITAAIKNGFNPETIILLEDYSEANTKKLIAGANCDSFTWNTKDYVGGAALMNPENKIAEFSKDLVNRKFSMSTLGLILFFESGKLGKKDFALLMEGKDIRNTGDCDLERANAFMEAAQANFEDRFLAKHYLISGVARLSKKFGYAKVLEVLALLTKQEAERITTAKSDNAVSIVVDVLNSHLELAQAG
jgi:hypothetical protein